MIRVGGGERQIFGKQPKKRTQGSHIVQGKKGREILENLHARLFKTDDECLSSDIRSMLIRSIPIFLSALSPRFLVFDCASCAFIVACTPSAILRLPCGGR